MKSFILKACFAMLLFLPISLLAQPCGLSGDGTGGSVAECNGTPTTMTYSLSANCCQGGSFWNWSLGTVNINQNTSFPVPISVGDLNGSITGATALSFTISWECVPCNGENEEYQLIVSQSCIENEVIRIGCRQNPGGGGNPICDVAISQTTCSDLNCLRFQQMGTLENCCQCVRVTFEDGTVLYSIIGIGLDNDASLCYEKPIESYSAKAIQCEEWCSFESIAPHPNSGGGIGPKMNGDNETEASPIQFFPNPSPDQKVNLRYESMFEGPVTVEIVDFTGKVLQRQTFDSQKGHNEWTIDCQACVATQAYNVVVLDQNNTIIDHKALILNF